MRRSLWTNGWSASRGRQNRITVYGKTYDEPRLTAWFGPAYRYSSIDWPAAQIPVELRTDEQLVSKQLEVPRV